MAACGLGIVGQGFAADEVAAPVLGSHSIAALLIDQTAPLSLRFDSSAGAQQPAIGEARLDVPSFRVPGRIDTVGPALISRYRTALERESRRLIDRNPSLLWPGPVDDDGYPAGDVQREATRIFEGANSRLMSETLERALQQTVALRHARTYLDGIRLDLLNGGGMKVGTGMDAATRSAGARAPGDTDPKASFSLMMVGHPRIEMQTTLPWSIQTRVELALTSPGIRATLSRRLTPTLRGTLGAGVEDSGSDRWLSAGIGVRF